ncbi:MAG: hypothetical protein ACOCWQ_01885 [Nanoarchaeota archaeon]
MKNTLRYSGRLSEPSFQQLYARMTRCIRKNQYEEAATLMQRILARAARYGPKTFERHLRQVRQAIR